METFTFKTSFTQIADAPSRACLTRAEARNQASLRISINARRTSYDARSERAGGPGAKAAESPSGPDDHGGGAGPHGRGVGPTDHGRLGRGGEHQPVGAAADDP